MTKQQIDALADDLTRGISEALRDHLEAELRARDATIAALTARLETLERGAVDGSNVETAIRQAMERS